MQRMRPIFALLTLLVFGAPIQPSSFEPGAVREVRVRWPRRVIKVALSESLLESPDAIIEGSDIEGAVRRAFNSWSNAANVRFVIVQSKLESISPNNAPDGTSLITIAPTVENLSIFRGDEDAARTRVFYNSETGDITEADIVINPFPYSEEGMPLQFSTDGTPGTYDLESTLAHEIGHLLGLSHSSVAAATMQPAQAINGAYSMPAVTERSLSEVDAVAVRALYGPCAAPGSVKGRILNSAQGGLTSLEGAHVWVEDLSSGRVVGSVATGSDGRFEIQCIPTGDYRAMVEYANDSTSRRKARQFPYRSVEIIGSLRVTAEKPATLNYIFVATNSSRRNIDPRLFGTNDQLSITPIPVRAGTKLTIYVSGLGVEQIPGTGFSFGSPFITVDPASLTLQHKDATTPVISFEATFASNLPAGDYTIRIQANSGEMAYLVGAVTVEPDLQNRERQ